MSSLEHDTGTPKARSRRRRWLVRALRALAGTILVWLLLAYVILPALWRHYEHQPSLADAPKTTFTSLGIPGDPLNVGLIGTEDMVLRSMLDSGWTPADPTTLRSSLRITRSVLFGRPDPAAPVSNLYVFRRKQDLAFEKASGKNARRRHHVRFWESADLGREGAPLWIGAVTFDKSVGFSHRTGQITHHIDADVDAERDGLIQDLTRAGRLTTTYQVTGLGATLAGRNGGGDLYFTDGEMTLAVLTTGGPAVGKPEELLNPPAVRLKDDLFSRIRPVLQATESSR
ncbi:MAG TPA: LssY C-terminal domain-containing protein [Isosphaeraceae bacterium]|jgi:hypothetical protein|nr:LssY C-terminal domain-containing protein [Isosphaeraceae bacterium]